MFIIKYYKCGRLKTPLSLIEGDERVAFFKPSNEGLFTHPTLKFKQNLFFYLTFFKALFKAWADKNF